MQQLLLFLLSNMLVFGDFAQDPANSAWQGRQAPRQFECERLTQAEAHERFPATVPPPNARSTALMQIDALDCRYRVVADGARSPRDEVILRTLQQEVSELSALAATYGDEDTHWIVDAYYPNQALVRKIASATRVALFERGLSVSDLPPRISAGDVEVLRTLPMREALPHACRRLQQTGMLESGPHKGNVGFLAVALLHPKESQLHAGVCRRGVFRWLR